MTITAQEVFDTAVGGIIEQGEFARLQRSTQCRCRLYRYGRTLKCAFGMLITDEEAAVADNRGSIDEMSEEEFPQRLGPHRKLLRQLQTAHDDARDMTDFILWTKDICRDHGLEWRYEDELAAAS
jgi:hypothetical protein